MVDRLPCPRPRGRRPGIDVKALLTAEIYAQGGDPVPSGIEPPPPLIPPANVVGFEDIALYFDSRRRDASSDLVNGEIRWSVIQLNNNNDIKGCIQMHLNEFYLPRPFTPVTAPDYFYEQRVFLEFLGAPTTQAVLGGSQGNFHFEFRVENITGQAVRLVPQNKSFFFQRPLTSVTEFAVRFLVPQKSGALLARIPLPLDTAPITLTLVAGAGTNPARFTIADTSIIGPIGVITPVAAFISGLATPDPVFNAAVGNPAGIFVTTVVSATEFEVTADATGLAALYTATLYLPKNRIALPVRFTCRRSFETNGIGVVHD